MDSQLLAPRGDGGGGKESCRKDGDFTRAQSDRMRERGCRGAGLAGGSEF